MKRVASILFVLMLSQSSGLLAQEQAAAIIDKSADIPRIEEAPRIDGALDEEIWEHALLVDDLHQVEPIEFATPTQKTEFLLAYDDDNICLLYTSPSPRDS